MPSPLTLLFVALFAVLLLYAAAAVAKDLAVLFLRAVGYLPALPVYGAARSGRWHTLEANWLKVHPHCAACGTRENVSVHHKHPFHLAPELELEPRNLITLCEKHCCHLMIGHSGDWHAFNPHVEADAAMLAKRVEKREYE